MSQESPPSLAWLPLLSEFLQRITLGSLAGWSSAGNTDPLKWVLILRFNRRLRADEPAFLRQILKDWAEANEAAYSRSDYDKYEFRALILLRGLGPEQKHNPYTEVTDARRRYR